MNLSFKRSYKRSILFVIALIACQLIMLAGAATAATYFVSLSGNDNNDGKTLTSAWQTIGNGDAKSILQPGDTVVVTEGTYPQSSANGVSLTNCSGSASAQIVYKASGRVVIDQAAYSGSTSRCINVGVNYIAIDGFELKNAQFGVYFTGGSSGACHDNTVRYCKIHDMRAPSPGSTDPLQSMCAGIYNSWAARNLLHNNVIYNIGTPGLVPTYGDNNRAFCIGGPACEDTMIFNNTLVNSWSGVMTWVSDLSRGVSVANTIIMDMWGYGINHNQGEYTLSNDFNMYYNNTANYGGDAMAGGLEFYTDPCFVNSAANDYRLAVGSPAIDMAVDLGLGLPYFGDAPEIGAYEFLPYAIDINSLSDLKSKPLGSVVNIIRPVMVSASSSTFMDGSYYLEDTLRASGIKAISESGLAAANLGDRMTLTGVLEADSNGERVVRVHAINSKSSGAEPGALGMIGKTVASGQPDVTGMLVRIWGWVTSKASDGSYVYVDDGSKAVDATGKQGIRVLLTGLTSPITKDKGTGQYVLITGEAGYAKDGTTTIRAIRPRSDADFVCLTPNPEVDYTNKWVGSNLGANAQTHPFSFTYGGQSSDSFIDSWQKSYSTTELDSQRTERTTTYTDPATGLVVRCVSVEYHDFPAVEWKLYFKNTGSVDTPIIESIKSLDSDFAGEGTGSFTLHYADGSTSLPTDFQPRETILAPNQTQSLSPNGGRSSDGTLPFFNLAKPDGTGVVVGVGWTGQWAASITRDAGSSVNVSSGMENTHLVLHPGEQIRTPSSLLLFWAGGDRWRGQNQLRRLLLEHYSPKPGGLPVVPPAAATPCIDFALTSESNMVQAINTIGSHHLPVDAYWIDAGWYTCRGSWLNVGTWDPDPARYPNGLKPVGDAAHAKGLKFILWFEPERVSAYSWLTANHPDWVFGGINGGLLNLGNPDALAWLKSKIGGIIGSAGVDVYRQDFNVGTVTGTNTLTYWRTGESQDRQGMNEINYITGLYDYLDYLTSTYPNLLIDNCASGGRRLDFEMARRSIPLWRTDMSGLIADQSIMYGLSAWLPIHGQDSHTLDPYNYYGGWAASMALPYNYYDTPIPENGCTGDIWQPLTTILNKYRSVRASYMGDYYPLTGYSTSENEWIAWQFDRPELAQGLVQAFRRSGSGVASMTFKLSGLWESANYRVENLDSGASYTTTGGALAQTGLTVSLSSPSSATVIRYTRIQ